MKIKLIFYNFIRQFIKSTENDIKFSVLFSFRNNDLSPKQCTKCGNKKFKLKTIDTIEYLEVEKESICIKCNSVQGHWAYGAWMP